MSRPLTMGLLLALTAAAAVLRTVALDQSFWLDELHTSWTVSGEWSDVAPRAMQGNQSPLYYWLLYAASGVLGRGEVGLRLPSVLAGVLLVPLVFAAVRHFTRDAAAGLLAAALVTVDRDGLFYSQEARPYAWVQLLAVGHVYLLSVLLDAPDPRRRCLFILGGWLLFYLHYTAALLIVAEGAALGLLQVSCRRRPAYRPAQWLVDLAAIGVGCLPALPHLMEIASRRDQWVPYVPAPTWLDFWFRFRTDLFLVLPALVVAAVAAADHWQRATRKRLERPWVGRPEAKAAILVSVWALLPRLIAGGLTAAGSLSLALPRYVIVSAAAPAVFAAGCWSLLTGRLARVALASVLLVLPVYRSGIVPRYFDEGRLVGDRREDWAGAVDYVRRHAAPDALVFLCAGLLEDAGLRDPATARAAYCRFPLLGRYRLGEERRIRPLPTRSRRRLQAADLAALRRRGEAWWIVRGNETLAAAVRDDLREQLAARGLSGNVVRRANFGHLTVWQQRLE